MNQQHAPLFEALRQRRARREASFHVPGHKFGQALHPDTEPYYKALMGLDYTEIEGLDDLHHPEGVIQEAQQLAAACFGAEATYFLVGGSTVGNLALLTTVCGRGDRILVQRNAHKSVLHGLMLAGAEAVFLEPEAHPETGIAAGVTLDTVKIALRAYPDAKAVFLTNPNYFGLGHNLAPYAEAAHQAGVPLLVDEAHGAHLGLHPDQPPSALQSGADGVVQSTHKLLTAMTMGAMLHVQGPRLDRGRLRQRLAMLQSSSPSYPLMASLDLARRLAATEGAARVAVRLQALQRFAEAARAGWRSLRLLGHRAGSGADWLDAFKLTVYDGSATNPRSGFELQQHLTALGIVPEMADERHVVLAASLASPLEDLDRAAAALAQLDRELQAGCESAPLQVTQSMQTPAPSQSHRITSRISEPVAFDMEVSPTAVLRLPFSQAAGRVSAETVIPYPPGIPILYAGERIRSETVERIRSLVETGAHFQSTDRNELEKGLLVRDETL